LTGTSRSSSGFTLPFRREGRFTSPGWTSIAGSAEFDRAGKGPRILPWRETFAVVRPLWVLFAIQRHQLPTPPELQGFAYGRSVQIVIVGFHVSPSHSRLQASHLPGKMPLDLTDRQRRRPLSRHHPVPRAVHPDRRRGRCRLWFRYRRTELNRRSLAIRCRPPAERLHRDTGEMIPNEKACTHCRTSKLAVTTIGLERTDSTSSRDHPGLDLRPRITTGLAGAEDREEAS
jgi:hypothetical protein